MPFDLVSRVRSAQVRVRPIAVAVAILGAQLVVPSCRAGVPVSGSAGYDYYAGPGGQTTRSLTGLAAAQLGRLSPSFALIRFDDSRVGKGVGLAGAVGVSAGGTTSLHAVATRYVGDETYRAWRFKVGPAFDLPGGRSLGIYFSHYSDDSSSTSNGVIAEFEAPLRERLIGRATGSIASAEGRNSGQGSIGLTWNPVHHLELTGDVGIAQSGAGAAGAFPSKKMKHNGSTTSGTNNPVFATAEVGLRVTFP